MSAKKIIRLFALFLLLVTALTGCELFLPTVTDTPNDDKHEDFTPTVFTEVVKTSFETRYYDQLSPNEKHIYDEIVKLSPGESTLSLSFPEVPTLCAGREPTEAETDALGDYINLWAANALYAAWLDHPEIFWIEFNAFSYAYELSNENDGIVKLKRLTVTLTPVPGIKDAEEVADALAEATVDFRPPRNASVPEKVAYINNYLCRRADYELEAPNRGSIIGALIDGRCVCEGYARAFSYLAAKAGLHAVCIPGYAADNPDGKETEGHMWNAVLIDGSFYAVDSTWNDSIGKNEYLLVGKETVCHGTAFGESHTPDMLMLEGPHKKFVFPDIARLAYGITENK